MRRPTTLTLTLAVVASTLAAVTFAAGPASAIPHPGGDDGNFYTTPATFEVGDTIRLDANFPNDAANQLVTFYRETSTAGEFDSIGTDEANSSGNAYRTGYQVNENQRVFARTSAGKVTEIKELTPSVPAPVSPTGPDTGNLYQAPTTYAEGDTIKLTANFPSGTFPITLYKEGPAETWSPVATKTSNSSGNADFLNFPVNGTQRIFARKANNDRTEVDVIAPSPKLTLDITRDCTGNECGGTATATGEFDPVVEGRVVKLQYLNGSTWTQIGNTATTGADGKAQVPLNLTGLSQWSTRKYRMVSDADASNPAAVSQEVSFMPGPTQLGANVLRVDVDKGVFPTSKSTEHTGEATLSVNGVVQHNQVPLENFGVRGTSTAKFDKRAYKLKFLNKPPSGTKVFGMDRAKSWSLLANWLDRSNVRDKVGLELGRKLDKISWTPDSRYVEMFVNDQYRGAYLLTESVKIDGDRVDVDETQGMIMETDGHTVSDSLLGFKSSKGIVFQFKDPDERKDGGADPTGVTSAKLSAIKSKVNAFESKLYTSSTREQYPDFIDVDSAIDFYLVKEFTKDRDADFFRSNYFSWDPSGRAGKPLSNGKLHFGPAWDFDRSAGITSENDTIHNYVQSPAGFYLRGTGIDNDHPNYKTHWFVQLFKSQSFRDKVDARWAVVKPIFEAASDDARAAAEAVGVGAENDRKRWVGPRKYAAHGSYQAEVDYVADWYDDRYAWLNANL